MNPLALVGKVLRGLAGLFAPMFVRPTLSPGVLWTIHAILIAAVAVGLWFLERHLDFGKNIVGPTWLRPFWLSLLFLLVYFLAWQAWWIWKLLQPTEAVAEFPDIDEAWAGITAALEKAGIGIADTPIFIVLGQQQAGEAALFSVLPRGLAVNGAPSAASPIRAYASREAIYLTCPGASLLGAQEAGAANPALAASYAAQSMAMEKSIGMDKSIGMSDSTAGGSIQQVQQIIRAAREQNRPLTEQEKNRIRQLSDAAGFSGGEQPAAPRGGGASAILQDARLVDRTTARTQFFCSLVSRARWPLCAINGAITVLSAAAAGKDEAAVQAGLVAQKDLSNLIDAFRLRFPTYILVAELDELPGADEFIRRFAHERRHQRLGKSFPLNPDLKPSSAPEAVETGAHWIFASLLPYWVFKMFKLETPNVETPNEAADGNGKLVQFLTAVKERADNVARMVSRAATPKADEVPCFGGCYLSAVEAGGAESLFAQEFFKKVESTQGFVAWTDEAFARDAGFRGKTRMGYLILGGIAVAVAALAAFVWRART